MGRVMHCDTETFSAADLSDVGVHKYAEDPYEAEAIILKNRKGENKTILLNWIPEYTSFFNRDITHHEE